MQRMAVSAVDHHLTCTFSAESDESSLRAYESEEEVFDEEGFKKNKFKKCEKGGKFYRWVGDAGQTIPERTNSKQAPEGAVAVEFHGRSTAVAAERVSGPSGDDEMVYSIMLDQQAPQV